MKKLFLLPVMMFALVGCNKPAAESQVKFEAAEFTTASTTAGAASLEKDGLKVEFTKVSLNDWTVVQGDDSTKTKELRINKSSDMKISGKTILKVEFVCQLDYVGSSSTTYYGVDGFTAEVGTVSTPTVAEREQYGQWEGEAADGLTLKTTNHQVRVYSFTVTCR